MTECSIPLASACDDLMMVSEAKKASVILYVSDTQSRQQQGGDHKCHVRQAKTVAF